MKKMLPLVFNFVYVVWYASYDRAPLEEQEYLEHPHQCFYINFLREREQKYLRNSKNLAFLFQSLYRSCNSDFLQQESQ